MDHQRIWDHFQTKGLHSFGHAAGRYRAMIAEARRCVGAFGSALNIGIGPGVIERTLHDSNWKVAALDPSEAAVQMLREHGIDARVGWAQAMDFEAKSFDIVIASEVLEHIEPSVRVLVYTEVRRVLKPGGWFVGSVPFAESLPDGEAVCPGCGLVFHRWGHVSRFDLADLRSELGQHFDDIRCRRTAFADWSKARSPLGAMRVLFKEVLGRLGEPVVSPSIQFVARVSARP